MTSDRQRAAMPGPRETGSTSATRQPVLLIIDSGARPRQIVAFKLCNKPVSQFRNSQLARSAVSWQLNARSRTGRRHGR